MHTRDSQTRLPTSSCAAGWMHYSMEARVPSAPVVTSTRVRPVNNYLGCGATSNWHPFWPHRAPFVALLKLFVPHNSRSARCPHDARPPRGGSASHRLRHAHLCDHTTANQHHIARALPDPQVRIVIMVTVHVINSRLCCRAPHHYHRLCFRSSPQPPHSPRQCTPPSTRSAPPQPQHRSLWSSARLHTASGTSLSSKRS